VTSHIFTITYRRGAVWWFEACKHTK